MFLSDNYIKAYVCNVRPGFLYQQPVEKNNFYISTWYLVNILPPKLHTFK